MRIQFKGDAVGVGVDGKGLLCLKEINKIIFSVIMNVRIESTLIPWTCEFGGVSISFLRFYALEVSLER